ncbi:aromatic acid exporter family protein [Salibacterium salarium]|uniref:Aromatic acid exporter family protein n=1 Tax=Salibacterium salarium TaxID=284579 RepID=A0A428N0Z3_9BACI|nr:aromatic acid exporter family protein [Salibacterium salarium]RSL32008.1 aromatic acid exporter family protein [Salibacterium salarium]
MPNWRIGYRTLKTAIGAALAIFIAQWLQLDFYVSAGIITVLCISVTKKESVRASWERIIACIIGLIYGGIIYEVLGYHPISIALLFLLFIPTAVAIGAKRGVVTSVVIMLHLYTVEGVTVEVLLNELMLIFIGVGVALVMNMYMPSNEKDLTWKQVKLEDCFRQIWMEFASYLQHGDNSWNGKEIADAAAIIEEGKGMALKNVDNHFLRNDDYFYHYYKMREKQFAVIKSILPFISTLDKTVVQGEKIASFMEELSQAVSPGNTSAYFLVRLNELRNELKDMDLPQTREEFEVRSSLFYILHELEEYLLTKKKFKPDPKRTRTVSGKRLNRDHEQRDTN